MNDTYIPRAANRSIIRRPTAKLDARAAISPDDQPLPEAKYLITYIINVLNRVQNL